MMISDQAISCLEVITFSFKYFAYRLSLASCFGGHGYIIVAIDYFTKWVEAMPTYTKDGKTGALFLFNHVMARFGVPQAIVTNHGSHFQN